MSQVFSNHHRTSTSWFHMRMAFTRQVSVTPIPYSYTQEVLCSNLGWYASYPDWDFMWLFWVTPVKCEDSLWVDHDPLPNPFQFICHPAIQNCILSNCCQCSEINLQKKITVFNVLRVQLTFSILLHFLVWSFKPVLTSHTFPISSKVFLGVSALFVCNVESSVIL
jgi:hypothetical protein